MKNYRRANCTSSVRNAAVDKWGRTIVVTGQFAFEWAITIYDCCGGSTTTTYKNGAKARAAFIELMKKR